MYAWKVCENPALGLCLAWTTLRLC
jgi:hypothetical protein